MPEPLTASQTHKETNARPKGASPPLWLRALLCLSTAGVLGALFYFVGVRLISHVYYTKATKALKANHHWTTVHYLKEAIRHQPEDAIFWLKLAKVYSTMGEQEKASIQSGFMYADQARQAYAEAYRRNPLDAAAAFGLARSESRLQQLYPYLYPENIADNPYDPHPYYEAAIKLRPNGNQYHFALARYLYQTGQRRELLRVVQALARMLPEVYDLLKREPLWSPETQDVYKAGLEEAIDEKIAVKDAHRSMAAILADEKNWSEAIPHFNTALSYQREISARDYTELGRLHLSNDAADDAVINFVKALTISSDKEKSLEAITRLFDSRNHQTEFSKFYNEIEKHFFLSPGMHITAAKKFIDLKQLEKARFILTGVNDNRPNGDAYYWLARIAETEKDWDAMEINIQKATLLEPANQHYRNLFLQLRKRLGKDKARGI